MRDYNETPGRQSVGQLTYHLDGLVLTRATRKRVAVLEEVPDGDHRQGNGPGEVQVLSCAAEDGPGVDDIGLGKVRFDAGRFDGVHGLAAVAPLPTRAASAYPSGIAIRAHQAAGAPCCGPHDRPAMEGRPRRDRHRLNQSRPTGTQPAGPADFSDPNSQTLATEYLGTSIGSGGDGKPGARRV
jgi:hypothetical protein